MMFTCGTYASTAACTDPRHAHRPGLKLRQGAAKSSAGARAATAAKLVRGKKKGASLRIDMHCHYLNPGGAGETAAARSGAA